MKMMKPCIVLYYFLANGQVSAVPEWTGRVNLIIQHSNDKAQLTA